MNNTYEVHCSERNESELDHDYNLFDLDNLSLSHSNGKQWEEKTRGKIALSVTEHNGFINIMIEGFKQPIQLDEEQEEQLLISLLYRNQSKIQIKQSNIIKEI